MEKRIGYIDIAKGLGILIIVLAHNDLAGYHPTLHKFIYSFHIPLFFFLSGMFFRPERSFGDTARRRFNSLMKPYFFTLFMIYLGEAAFSNMTFPVIAGRIVKALYATGKYIDWVQLWFIPHLFVVSLFAWIAWRFVLGRIKWDWLRWLLLFAMLAAGVYSMPYFWSFTVPIINLELFGLPFSLDLVLASGFFFLAGYEVNQRPLEKLFASPALPAGDLRSAAGSRGDPASPDGFQHAHLSLAVDQHRRSPAGDRDGAFAGAHPGEVVGTGGGDIPLLRAHLPGHPDLPCSDPGKHVRQVHTPGHPGRSLHPAGVPERGAHPGADLRAGDPTQPAPAPVVRFSGGGETG